MKLISLPDCKNHHKALTLDKEYKIHGELGNGYIVELDDQEEKVVILKERFE